MAPPRIIDPHAAPVIGTDAQLPAVPPERLSADALRQRLVSARAWHPEFPGDGSLLRDRTPAPAAVLVGLVERTRGLQVLLTQRTAHLREHAGQISFPGGRTEPGDAGAAATALREADEEIGLPPSQVEVIGSMPTYTTVTHFIVTPVVALVQPPLVLAPDANEVAEVFEVPLAWLMNPAHHRWHLYSAGGIERRFLSMPWTGPAADGTLRDYFIWGATAAMLRNLYRLLAE